MERLSVRKKYTLVTNSKDELAVIIKAIIKKSPPDFRVAVFAGCEIGMTRSDNFITLRTVNPISILKDKEGAVIHVMEMPPTHPNYPKK